MKRAECTSVFRDNSGRIVKYLLQDKAANKCDNIIVSPDEVKAAIKSGKLVVDNLYIDSNNRLLRKEQPVSDKDQQIMAKMSKFMIDTYRNDIIHGFMNCFGEYYYLDIGDDPIEIFDGWQYESWKRLWNDILSTLWPNNNNSCFYYRLHLDNKYYSLTDEVSKIINEVAERQLRLGNKLYVVGKQYKNGCKYPIYLTTHPKACIEDAYYDYAEDQKYVNYKIYYEELNTKIRLPELCS